MRESRYSRYNALFDVNAYWELRAGTTTRGSKRFDIVMLYITHDFIQNFILTSLGSNYSPIVLAR